MSYKVSVDSVADADTDDVLVAIVNLVFRYNTVAGWTVFGLTVFVPVCLSTLCWIGDQFLGATVFSAIAMVLVLGRLLGQSREEPIASTEESEDMQAQA